MPKIRNSLLKRTSFHLTFCRRPRGYRKGLEDKLHNKEAKKKKKHEEAELEIILDKTEYLEKKSEKINADIGIKEKKIEVLGIYDYTKKWYCRRNKN